MWEGRSNVFGPILGHNGGNQSFSDCAFEGRGGGEAILLNLGKYWPCKDIWTLVFVPPPPGSYNVWPAPNEGYKMCNIITWNKYLLSRLLIISKDKDTYLDVLKLFWAITFLAGMTLYSDDRIQAVLLFYPKRHNKMWVSVKLDITRFYKCIDIHNKNICRMVLILNWRMYCNGASCIITFLTQQEVYSTNHQSTKGSY